MRARVLMSYAMVPACGVALALTMVVGASADDLKMVIDNKTSNEFYYDAAQNVKTYPQTIAASSKSQEIYASRGGGKGSVGQITYMNAQNQADATCSVTLEFSWILNPDGKCDDKNFTFVNKNGCTLDKDDCGSNNDCTCNFNLTSSN
jgi:hypothetical protein